MAAVDTAIVHVTGKGGHGATPHECVDPVVAIVGMVGAMQTIIPRNLYALDEAVISVTQIHTGTASNIIPEEAMVLRHDPLLHAGGARSAEAAVPRDRGGSCAGLWRARRGWTTTGAIRRRSTTRTRPSSRPRSRARLSGEDAVDARGNREMGSEDFAYMLEARPGAYLFLGTGPGAGLHHPAFDFNDEAAPVGASFFARLVERAQPLA